MRDATMDLGQYCLDLIQTKRHVNQIITLKRCDLFQHAQFMFLSQLIEPIESLVSKVNLELICLEELDPTLDHPYVRLDSIMAHIDRSRKLVLEPDRNRIDSYSWFPHLLKLLPLEAIEPEFTWMSRESEVEYISEGEDETETLRVEEFEESVDLSEGRFDRLASTRYSSTPGECLPVHLAFSEFKEPKRTKVAANHGEKRTILKRLPLEFWI